MYGSYGQLGVPRVTPAVRGLIAATLIAFVVQLVSDLIAPNRLTAALGLSLPDVMRGQLWQLFTYPFLHGSLMHVLMNMLGLLMFGPDVERVTGARRFISFYMVCAVLGGVGWLLLTAGKASVCVGASGAIFGVIAAFAVLFPDRPVTLLLFFVLPVTMTARTLAIMYGVITFLSLFGADGNIAHAAHLVGGLAGFLYARRLAREPARPWASDGESPDWWKLAPRPRRRSNLRLIRPEDEAPGEDEVDQILEKISASGIGSLSRRERETLERASRDLKQR